MMRRNRIPAVMSVLQVFQSDFAVYDMGFYSHHSSLVGGIPDVITNAIANRITHSYYLFLGREMDNEGSLKKVWVEMKLPEGDYLACLESAQKTFHAHMAGTFLNGPAIIGKNDSYQYMEQSMTVIYKERHKVFTLIFFVCSPGFIKN